MLQSNEDVIEMDKKALEENRGKDITYETELEVPIVSEAKVAYEVDELVEYEKYRNLPEMTRAEFTDGKIYYLASANDRHQELLLRLGLRFGIYLHGKQCTMRWAPSDVKIEYELDQFSRETVQPDLYVYCDEKKKSKQGLNGAPDLVIEILSPSDPSRDKVFKFNKYLKVGVKEYWIVDPVHEEVTVNVLKGMRYETIVYVKGDVIKPTILDSLHLNVTELFEGSEGDEIPEIELVREEERVKAEDREYQIREEEREKLESEQEATVKRFLEMGLSNSEVAQGIGVDEAVILKICEATN